MGIFNRAKKEKKADIQTSVSPKNPTPVFNEEPAPVVNEDPAPAYVEKVEIQYHSKKFTDLSGTISDYASMDKAVHTPTVPEIIAHLKVMKAFHELRMAIERQVPENLPPQIMQSERERFWKYYLTNAVRRFVVWVSALQYECLRSELFKQMDMMLPPLDVCLVWHSFLLSPKTVFDQFQRNGFSEFLKFPFPLKRISNAIENETFMFRPSKLDEEFCNALVHKFLATFSDTVSFTYDAYAEFSPHEINVPICCPSCKHNICAFDGNSSIPLPMFCDPKFRLHPAFCSCEIKYTYLNHETLRVLQLLKDLKLERTLPGINKFFSVELNDVYEGKAKCRKVNEILKEKVRPLVQKNYITTTLPNHMMTQLYGLYGFPRIIIREYFKMNLVYLTIPNKKVFELHEDLVSSCLRQQKFIQSMQSLNWLHSPCLDLSIREAIDRYHKFFKIIKKDDYFKVPTLDIDLVWHTHQLSQPHYFQFSKSLYGTVIDHNDKVEENQLNNSFTKTCQLYRQKYKENYTICSCVYCTITRSHHRGMFSKELSTKTSLVEGHSFDSSHISSHPAMLIPTLKAASQVKKRRKVIDDKATPWHDDETCIHAYVDPPTVVLLNSNIRENIMFYRHSSGLEEKDPLSACYSKYTSGYEQPKFIYEHNNLEAVCTGCANAECGTFEDGNAEGGRCVGAF